MTTLWWVEAVVLVVLVVVAWCVWTATRLDRLHLRCDATEAAVRAHCTRRSSLALELATAGVIDPASALALVDAATRARDAEGDAEWVAESELSRVLQLVAGPGPSEEPLVGLLHDAQLQAAMARRIHNDGVASALALRGRRRVRWFRLAGNSAPPRMIEFDDGLR